MIAPHPARIAACALLVSVAGVCLAGTPQKWEALPQAVRDTVLANGGTAGMTVDQESEVVDGLATFEAGVKAADGTIHDLVITANGKLIETKTDDAADAAQERVDRATTLLKGVTFSHPRDITNLYLPLASVKRDVLAGKEDGKAVRVERVAKPDIHKTFQLAGQSVEALAVEDRDFEGDALNEVTLDYFAQDDAGNVYYLGEEVDEYANGKVTGHDGTWLAGKAADGSITSPGILFPAKPAPGLKWRSEDVSAEISEVDEIVSMSEKVKTPSGEYVDCIKVKEVTPDETEYKFYAKAVGVVCEQPHDGDVKLVSHEVVE